MPPISRLFSMLFLTWSALFFLLAATSTDARELRLGIFDWATLTDGDGIRAPIDEDVTRAMTTNFLIAVRMFNERRDDVFPVLGEPWVKNCDVNITVVRYCDTQADVRRTMSELNEMLYDIHAIAGFATAQEGKAPAIAADVLNDIVVVSHWLTSMQTNNRAIYPLFTRTVISDSSMTTYLKKFLAQMGYTKVAGMMMNQDSAPEFKQALASKLEDEGIEARFFSFDYADEVSIDRAMSSVHDTGFNVIVVVTYADDVASHVANAAKKYGLTSGNKMFVFTNVDRPSNLQETLENANLSQALTGAIRVSTRVDPNNTRWTKYLNEWENNFQERYGSFINSSFPPHGDANDNASCVNDDFDMSFGETFFADTVGKAHEIWGTAHDSVLALGLASCVRTQAQVARGADLFADLMSLSFDGLSGRVEFDNVTGDRREETFAFQVQNFQPAGPLLAGKQPVVVGTYNFRIDAWEFDRNATFYFRQGMGLASLTSSVDPVYHDKQYLSPLLVGLGSAEVFVIWSMSLLCALWLYVYRAERIVINSQGSLMCVLVLGCNLAGAAIIGLMSDDNPERNFMNPNVGCMVAPICFLLGFQLAILALIGKSTRVYRVWNNKTPMLRGFRAYHVISVVLVIVICMVVVMIAWLVVAPLKWERLITSSDRFGQPLSSLGLCAAPSWTSGGFAIFVFCAHGLVLMLMGVAAYEVSDLPGQFGEARWLGLSFLALAQVFFISIPAVAAVYTVNVSGRFVLETSLVFVSALALLFFMFVPKMYALHTGGRELFKKSGTQSRELVARITDERLQSKHTIENVSKHTDRGTTADEKQAST